MNRRAFLSAVMGTLLAAPLAVQAKQMGRVRDQALGGHL
jgi:hypothetical protein